MMNSLSYNSTMQIIDNQTFDEERALYGIQNAVIDQCVFDGPADGESALKEASNIKLQQCDLRLRYPLWHVTNATVERCTMAETCRAALWYDRDLEIVNSTLGGIKALRECEEVKLDNCTIQSSEFAWRCRDVEVNNSSLISEYPFFECSNVHIDNLDMTAKYSFQYVSDMEIRNSHFKTKDAFWHTKNVTVFDSVLEGEYLAWYSENLRLVRCHIKGTQPFCYCKNLVLENCTMEGCDLAFERSEVQAEVHSHIDSVKNPLRGTITADSIGELIMEEDIVNPTDTVISTSNESDSNTSLPFNCSSTAA